MPTSKNASDYPRGADGLPLRGEELIEYVKQNSPCGPRVLLSFSGGKDSLAMWLHLREHFEIIPYHLYWLPGLSFVEEALDYYEDFFSTKIIRLPHPHFYDMLRTFAYREPHEVAVVAAMSLPAFDFADVENIIASHYKLDAPFSAVGMRASESVERRHLILKRGSVGVVGRRFFFPIWDWKVDDVAAVIKSAGVKLPADYKYWGRTLGAYDYQYLRPLRDAFPADFEKIKLWFPLIEAEFFRYEAMEKWG